MVTEEEMKAKIQEYRTYLEEIKTLIEKFIKQSEEIFNDFDNAN